MMKRKILATGIWIIILLTAFAFITGQVRNPKKRPVDGRDHFIKIKKQNAGRPFSFKGRSYASNEILVRFKDDVSPLVIESAIKAYRTREIKRYSRRNLYRLEIPEDQSVEEMIYLLENNPDVMAVGPNYRIQVSMTPNDPFFTYQYALYNRGGILNVPGSPQGIDRADIKAPEGWEESLGNPDVVVAVLDTGVDLQHPDISGKIVSGGRDFMNDDYDADDDHGHGTHVAGIIAADTDNNDGIAGVAWNCRILPIKVLDESGGGTYFELIQGIDFAADYNNGEGVNVINISAGGLGDSPALRDSLMAAYNKNIVIVASAGNDGAQVEYPAAYDDYCMAVASTEFSDTRSDFSNIGPEIDVAAPGESILSLWPIDLTESGFQPYAWGWGTSQAAPHVSGLAALIISLKPWLSNAEIMDVIRFSADDINSAEHPGRDDQIGYGRINMEKALVPIKITSSR